MIQKVERMGQISIWSVSAALATVAWCYCYRCASGADPHANPQHEPIPAALANSCGKRGMAITENARWRSPKTRHHDHRKRVSRSAVEPTRVELTEV